MAEPQVEQVQRELRRVLRALRHGRRGPGGPGELRKRRLGPRHVAALNVIAHEHGEPLAVGELARRMGISLTAASQIASELNMADLVERTEDQDDRRRTLVALQERRRAIVQNWLEERARPIEAALARLAPAERDAFVRGLSVLAEELERGAPPRHGHA